MIKFLQIIICGLTLFTHTTWSMWDFAITTKSKILFYDDQWRELTTSAHQFDQLSAITFDETEEVIYFNDLLHNNASIFSLKIPLAQDDPHIIEKVVQRTLNETITSIAFDPLQRNLYWADQRNRAIYYVPIDAAANTQPKIFIDFSVEHTLPDGIAIDICRRKLYWTNSNFTGATIESIDLDNGNDRHVVVSDHLYLPHGIIVDQYTNRLYWVVDQQGMHFSVESAELDGTDRRVIVKGLNNVPLNLVVTKDAILWTDLTHNAIWSHPKLIAEDAAATADVDKNVMAPHKVLTFTENARGIVARTRFLTNLQNDRHCAAVIGKIKKRLLTPKPTSNPLATEKTQKARGSYCLNGGELIEQSGVCICRIGFKGPFCETSECHNFCVHGTCTMSSMGFPKCTCQRGFHGERCQARKCTGYCLNDGVCEIESNGEPSCECKDNFGGPRCEQNSTEICALFCRILKHEPDTYVPFGCHDICEELAEQSEDGHDIYAIPTYKHLEVCRNTGVFSSTVIVVLVSGVVISFSLVLLIVHGVRRFYKPARPRIKKTFVVRKQATTASADTPLTNRPIATEQCEITIENCCNMNICDTPCFDPKLVQQTLSRDSNTKEDKKMLIHNMEDDLY